MRPVCTRHLADFFSRIYVCGAVRILRYPHFSPLLNTMILTTDSDVLYHNDEQSKTQNETQYAKGIP